MSLLTKSIGVVALSSLLSVPVQAAVIFSDYFDGYAVAYNANAFGGNWTVSNGSVDVVGPGYFDFFPGNGNYIDLDGSTGDAGVFTSKTLNLNAGTYTFEFVLSGSTRWDEPNTVDVSFGSYNETFTLAYNVPITKFTKTVNFASDTATSIVFKNSGNDNMGALLFNVTVASAVPEAETGAMILAGLGIIGSIVRRRKSI